MKKFLFIVLTAFAMHSFAAEDFTLWASETVDGPYVGDVVAISSEVTNNSGFNAIELIVDYESFTPDGANAPADYKLYAIIEQKMAGIWYPAGYQFRGLKSSESATKKILIMAPNVPDFNGAENDMYVGNIPIASQSYNTGVLGSTFRVKIVADNSGISDLTSVTFSAYGRKFNQ